MEVHSSSDSSPSPDFKRPPVVETALGIQFEELEGFRSLHFGLFYDKVKDRYPVFEDHERLPPIIETFPPIPKVVSIQFKAPGGPGRGYYRDESNGCSLVQVQADRFGYNWRKASDDTAYPRYAENIQCCLQMFSQFTEFCHEQKLDKVRPNVCEVVYVNHIRPQPGELAVDLFPEVFSGVQWRTQGQLLPAPEGVNFSRTYEIGNQQGRLYAEAAVAFERKQKDSDSPGLIVLKMTGRVLAGEERDVEIALNTAHEWVVQGFVELTNPTFREDRWEQKL